MRIIRTNKELTVKEQFALTMAPTVGKMKDAVGQVLELDTWCKYEDVDKDGNPHDILSIKTKDGDVMATNSPTFISDFERMADLFEGAGEVLAAVEVVEGKSKAGRTFITCTIPD